MADKDKLPGCAQCPYSWSERLCKKEKGKAPANCPTLHHRHLTDQALTDLKDEKNYSLARQASIQECQGYAERSKGYAKVRPAKPRIEETIEFAKKMEFTRLGLVFCVGLRQEAAIVQEILETNGFEVVSVICKAGRISKKELDLGSEYQIDIEAQDETMCNPILQAAVVNHYQVEFNILFGLCVGHDTLFIKHAKGLCTVLAVKDRLLGHNPLAAIYGYDGYYRYLKNKLSE